MRDRKNSCCFTGHRDIPRSARQELERRLDDAVRALISQGYTVFCAGGAMGFDTMAARAVLKYKKQGRRVQLHLYLPCPDQDKYWPRRARREYAEIKKNSDMVCYRSDKCAKYSFAVRNRALVDNSSVCVGYCTRTTGGSAYTMNYALDNGLKVINLARLI